MHPLLWTAVFSCAFVLALALLFHLAARLGRPGTRFCDWCARAPALDVVVFLFTHGPWVLAAAIWWWGVVPEGWSTPTRWGGSSLAALLAYVGMAIVGQGAALIVWSRAHELVRGVGRARIVTTLNRRVGFARNHLAVWYTSLAVPIFTLVRVGEIVIYPPITWLVRLPKYPARDWVNVSRQKFDGLVGYDLIWCLYCDWMTGVWSLGSEMLRNIESFWCPIRFSSPEKCANCAIDFPDVDHAWVPPTPTGSMEQVASHLERQYPGPNGVNAWAGHPVRITVKGEAVGARSRDSVVAKRNS
jgi:hypothetical protein